MTEAPERLKLLLFSDDRTVREEVRLTLGRKVASDLPEIEMFEVATGPALLRTLDAGTHYDLLILDAEAQPHGGMGLGHQIKEEYPNSPPVLLLVARPLSVVASVIWFRFGWRDMAFLSWAGLRGAVPIVLTTIPVAQHTKGSSGLFETVFLLVIVFTLVQAPTLPRVARMLGLIDDAPRDLELDSSPLEAMRARIMQVSVGATSQLHGVSLLELRLPADANVTLILRDGKAIVPRPETRLHHGDSLLLVASDRMRAATEERLHQVSSGGRLGAWRPQPGSRG